MDSFTKLPLEIICLILSFLDYPDFINFCFIDFWTIGFLKTRKLRYIAVETKIQNFTGLINRLDDFIRKNIQSNICNHHAILMKIDERIHLNELSKYKFIKTLVMHTPSFNSNIEKIVFDGKGMDNLTELIFTGIPSCRISASVLNRMPCIKYVSAEKIRFDEKIINKSLKVLVMIKTEMNVFDVNYVCNSALEVICLKNKTTLMNLSNLSKMYSLRGLKLKSSTDPEHIFSIESLTHLHFEYELDSVVSYFFNTYTKMNKLANLKNLSKLKLSTKSELKELFDSINTLTSLNTLVLENKIDDNETKISIILPNLTSLKLNMTYANIEKITCPFLKEISINAYSLSLNQKDEIPAISVKYVTTRLVSDGIPMIDIYPNANSIELTCPKLFLPVGYFANSTHLKNLTIVGTSINENFFNELGRLVSLVKLILYVGKFNNNMESLKSCESLKVIRIYKHVNVPEWMTERGIIVEKYFFFV